IKSILYFSGGVAPTGLNLYLSYPPLWLRIRLPQGGLTSKRAYGAEHCCSTHDRITIGFLNQSFLRSFSSGKFLPLPAALQFQADIHKIVRRPWAGIFEIQAVAKFLRDFVYGSVELGFTGLLDQERGIHDHLVANGFVVAGSNADRAQSVINFTDVVCGQFRQGLIDHAAQLHASEVRGLQVLARKFLMEAMDFIMLALQLFNDAVAVPSNFQTEFKFAGHLLENVFQRWVDALEHFADIVVRTKHRAKAHGNDGVILHHRFDHVLMGQGIVTRGVKDKNRRAADHGGDIAVMHGVHVLIHGADAAATEADRGARFNHAINIAAFLLLSASRLHLYARRWRNKIQHSRRRFSLNGRFADRCCLFPCLLAWTHYLSSTFWRLSPKILQSQSA